MKAISYALTLSIHIILVFSLKLLDDFRLIVLALFISLLTGTILNFFSQNPLAKNIGWGIFYGSLTSIIILAVFMLWLSQVLH